MVLPSCVLRRILFVYSINIQLLKLKKQVWSEQFYKKYREIICLQMTFIFEKGLVLIS